MPKGEGPGRPCLDLAGRTFGFLLAIARVPLVGSDDKPLWLCYCHGCGGFACVSSHRLVQRGQMTCGCFRYYKSEASKFRHSKRYRIILKSRAAAIRWRHKRRGKQRYEDGTLRVRADRSDLGDEARQRAAVAPAEWCGTVRAEAAGDG